MNYLAHFHLSHNIEGLIVGNYIADFIKGKAYLSYPKEVQSGILLHREIDHFTDSHPIVLETKKRLYPKYHKYAAVIVDMFYDHILASNWDHHSKENLKEFTLNIYAILIANKEFLPTSSQHMLTYMMRDNWLHSYASLEGMGKALNGLSKRTKFDSKMENSINELEKDYSIIKTDFDTFYPDLIARSSQFIEDN